MATMPWDDVPFNTVVEWNGRLFLREHVNPWHGMELLTQHERYASRVREIPYEFAEAREWIMKRFPERTHWQYTTLRYLAEEQVRIVARVGEMGWVGEDRARFEAEEQRRAETYLDSPRAGGGLMYIHHVMGRSVYADVNGREVVFRGRRRLLSIDEIDVEAMCAEFSKDHGDWSRFPDWVAEHWLADVSEVSRLHRCYYNSQHWAIDMPSFSDAPSYHLCVRPECASRAIACQHVDEDGEECGNTLMYPRYGWNENGARINLCPSCVDGNYAYCGKCSMYYPGDVCPEDHRDSSAKCCTSPMMEFSIGLADGSRLANDQRATANLSSDISYDGQRRIKRLFRDHWVEVGNSETDNDQYRMYVSALDAVDFPRVEPVWTDSSRRTYPRRLAKYIYDETKIKVPKDLLAKVGVVARDCSIAATLEVEITRELDGPAEDYAHAGSCWFDGSYSYSRCTLKSHAGFALRSFSDYGVTGRAWVFPVNVTDGKIRPTFDEPDGYFVFNAYGDLGERVAARALSTITGMKYMTLIGTEDMDMYVNGCSGYLLLPSQPEIVPGDFSDLEKHYNTPEVPASPVLVVTEPEPEPVGYTAMPF